MTPTVQDILSRHYGYRRGRGAATPSPDELGEAAAAGFPVDRRETAAHDALIDRALRAAARLDLPRIAGAFVAGAGGSVPRGRQLLISYLWARHLRPHRFEGTGTVCETCGLGAEASMDATKARLRLRLGWAWNEQPERYVVDLEDAVATGVPEPAATDRSVLHAVLAVAAAMPAQTSPSGLEKELSGLRVLPGTDKYRRLGILEALAEAGVLPNRITTPSYDRFVTWTERVRDSKQVHVSHRSDIVLPFGAWRGADGVNWARASELFGITGP